MTARTTHKSFQQNSVACRTRLCERGTSGQAFSTCKVTLYIVSGGYKKPRSVPMIHVNFTSTRRKLMKNRFLRVPNIFIWTAKREGSHCAFGPAVLWDLNMLLLFGEFFLILTVLSVRREASPPLTACRFRTYLDGVFFFNNGNTYIVTQKSRTCLILLIPIIHHNDLQPISNYDYY